MQTTATALSCLKSDLLSVFITNLGKYNEGELVGEWLSLPVTPEQIQASLTRIGIDNIQYEEYFLTDYESAIEGVGRFIGEYSNLNELNYLAHRLSELDDYDKARYEAIIQLGGYIYSVKDLINLVDNLDCFDYIPDIDNEYDLGCYWIEESGCYDLNSLENLASYLDYERFGIDIVLEQGGTFTNSGYIYRNGENFNEGYDGKVIPEEYSLF